MSDLDLLSPPPGITLTNNNSDGDDENVKKNEVVSLKNDKKQGDDNDDDDPTPITTADDQTTPDDNEGTKQDLISPVKNKSNDETGNNDKNSNNDGDDTVITQTLATQEKKEPEEDFSSVDISKLNVSKEEIDEIFDIFTLYDRNGDGVITESDLTIVIESMQKSKPTQDEVRRAIRAMIPHHEGNEVDFPSFLWYKLHDRQLRQKSANSKDIIEAFRHFDKDKDGFWGIGDLRYMFNQIDVERTEDQLQETLEEVDVDGDGRIGFEDFRKTMTSFIPNSLKDLKLKGLSWRRTSVLR